MKEGTFNHNHEPVTKINLNEVRVRPILKAEQECWDQRMKEYHYLGWSGPVGESLAYVVTLGEQWLGLLAFGSASYSLKDREAWIGWNIEQKKKRLKFITQNRRFLILPWVKVPNLASRALGLALRRLKKDWEEKYQHPIFLVETFVDPQRFEGTCYQAAGWIRTGRSAGYGRASRDFYVEHEHPKELWIKPLRKDAAEQLRSPSWPKSWSKHELEYVPVSSVNVEQSRSLFQALREIPEFRKARGKSYSLSSILTCAACATLAGAKNPAEMAEIIAGFNQHHLRALRCRKNWRTGRSQPPSETTLRRVLAGVDVEKFDAVVARWVSQQENIQAIAFDGKAVKGCLDKDERPLFLVSAVSHGSAAPCGQVAVESKTNEIPAARELLRQIGPLDGVMCTADAAHTQIRTAQQIVMEQGGDYLLPLKGNQPSILQTAEALLPQSTFFPSGYPTTNQASTRTFGTA